MREAGIFESGLSGIKEKARGNFLAFTPGHCLPAGSLPLALRLTTRI
jgi:hypothetical protein